MNAGQKLVELSGLPSGSALEHLLAITQGTGTGPGEIVLTSRLTVCMTESRTAVLQVGDEPMIVDQRADVLVSSAADDDERIDVFLPKNTLYALARPQRMVSLQHKRTDAVCLDAPSDVITLSDL